MDTKYFARRDPVTGDVHVFYEGMKVPFGTIANCETAYVFIPADLCDEDLASAVNEAAEPDFTLREWLATIRYWADKKFAEQEAIAAAERWAENGWLRAAEAGDMESWMQEDRDRELDYWFGRRGE